MTHVITARNVNVAFAEGWWHLRTAGIGEDSRNGRVIVAPGPVITEYRVPTERVLFNEKRDANPVFHLMECIWMLAGENHTSWLEQFNPRMADYTEDHVMHAAYGHRWRRHFNIDQLPLIVGILKTKPDSRQAVLQMWDPEDLMGTWKDRACNTAAYFDCRGGVLNMTVTCRSNDMLWGAYGANAVHFSFLQEVLAHAIGVPVGVYRQFSNNFHVYADLDLVKHFLSNPPYYEGDRYTTTASCTPYPVLAGKETMADLTADCRAMILDMLPTRTAFMCNVAAPLYSAYMARKTGNPWSAKGVAECDWKYAFVEWAKRRNVK